MPEPPQTEPSPLHFGWGCLISYGLLLLIFAVDAAFRWSDPLSGFMNALLFTGWLLWIPWLLFGLPWSLGVWGLYRMLGWRRFRTFWMLLPIWGLMLFAIGALLIDPPSVSKTFHQLTGMHFPAEMENFEVAYLGGGFDGVSYWYTFETEVVEVEQLIDGLNLMERTDPMHGGGFGMMRGPFRELPEPSTWPGLRYFEGEIVNNRFVYLTTDAEMRRVLLVIAGY